MSLKAVQEEIEKTLASNLKTRFLEDQETSRFEDQFEKQDVERLKGNDLFFRLFIRARQGDLEKAYDMMVQCLKWRKAFKINEIKEEKLNEEVLQKGLLFYRNVDKKRHPIYVSDEFLESLIENSIPEKTKKATKYGMKIFNVIFQGNQYPCKKERQNVKELEKIFAFLLEIQQQNHLGEKIIVICDHHDAKLENMDVDFFRFIVNLFSIYYPRILDSFLVVDVSWRLSAVWKVIKSWLSPDMFSRFKFVDRSKLTDYVDKSKLLSSLSGEDRFTFSYPPSENLCDHVKPPENNNLHDLSTSSSHEDLFREKESESAVEREHLLKTEDKFEHEYVLTNKGMGGSLGTHIRNRFKDHRTSMEEKLPADVHLDDSVLLISPNDEISFCEVEHGNEVQETITLKNISENIIIFKVKTNSAAHFRVRPSVGALAPGSSKEITLMLLMKGDSSQGNYSKDKFLIQYSEITEEITTATDISELWKNIPKIDINEHRLNCRVLDVNGLEKRPKTIEDVIEMSLRLKQQTSLLQTKVGNLSNSLSEIKNTLHQQILMLIVIFGFVLLSCLLYWFR